MTFEFKLQLMFPNVSSGGRVGYISWCLVGGQLPMFPGVQGLERMLRAWYLL